MLSAYYINELLINFLHKYDPQPEIYALYETVLQSLVGRGDIAASLRSFEMEFLSLLGYAVNLNHEFGSTETLLAEQYYEYRMEQGPVAVQRSEGPLVFSGALLSGVAEQRFDDADVLRVANRLMHDIIRFHLSGKELKSRKVLMELHRGRIAPVKTGNINSGQ